MEQKQTVTLTGRVAKQPELKTSSKGKPFFKASVVAQMEDGTETWVNALAFGEFAKTLSIALNKGTLVRLTGGLTQKEYQKKDGSVGVDTSVFVSKAKFSSNGKSFTVDELTDIGELTAVGFSPRSTSNSDASGESPF